MISKMRSTLNASAYRLILLAFLGIFIISSLSLGLLFREKSNAIMRINNYTVSKAELGQKTQTVDNHIKTLRQQLGGYADYFLQQLGLLGDPSQIALQELLKEKLLLSAADSIGITSLSDDYVAQKLNNATFAMQHLGMLVQPYFYNAVGDLNRKAISNYLGRQGMSFSSFIESVENALRQFFVVSLGSTSVYVAPSSIIAAWDQNHAKKRTYSIYEIKLSRYLKDLQQSSPTEQELRDYFKKHNDATQRYWSDEQRQGTAWKFSASRYGIPDITSEQFATRFVGDARRTISSNNMSDVQNFVEKHRGKKIVIAANTAASNPESKFLTEKLASIASVGKNAFGMHDKEGYIITLDDLKKRQPIAFQAAQEQVMQDFLQDKARSLLYREMNDMLQQNTPGAVTEFLKTKGGAARAVTFAGTEDSLSKQVQELEKEGLPAKRMQLMIHPGYALIYGLPEEDGVGIIVLESLDKVTPPVGEPSLDAITRKLTSQETSLLSAAFIDYLQKNATINTKEL